MKYKLVFNTHYNSGYCLTISRGKYGYHFVGYIKKHEKNWEWSQNQNLKFKTLAEAKAFIRKALSGYVDALNAKGER